MWSLKPTDKFVRQRKRYEKKHPHELQAVELNLHRVIASLEEGARLAQLKFGFFRSEKGEVYRIGQEGGNQGKLKETRLYVHIVETTQTIYLLTIGDKQSQRDDIKRCHEFVKHLKTTAGQTHETDQGQDIPEHDGDGA